MVKKLSTCFQKRLVVQLTERIQEYDVEEETDSNITKEEIAGEQSPYLNHKMATAHTHIHTHTQQDKAI